jgi:hypothetical protein
MDLTTFISKLRDVPMANADDTPLIRLQIDVLGSFAPLQAGADELETDLAIFLSERPRRCERLQSLRVIELRPRIRRPTIKSVISIAASVPFVSPHFAKPVAE